MQDTQTFLSSTKSDQVVQTYLAQRAAAERKAFEEKREAEAMPKSRQARRAEQRAMDKSYRQIGRRFALYEAEFLKARKSPGYLRAAPKDDLERAFERALIAKHKGEVGGNQT